MNLGFPLLQDLMKKAGIRPWKGGVKQRQQQQRLEQAGAAAPVAGPPPKAGAGASAASSSSQAPKKRGRPPMHADQGPQETLVLRQRMRLKFLKNKQSAEDIVQDGLAAWTAGTNVGNVLQAGAQGAHPQNASRDLLRRFLQPNAKWPAMYMVKLPFLDVAEQVDFEIPVFLPHELVHIAMNLDDLQPLNCQLQSWFRNVVAEINLPEDEVVPLTLWGDGVPYTKTGSLFQVMSKGLPERLIQQE